MARRPIAIIDNTLLSCLGKVGIHDRLPMVFDRVLIPPAVNAEHGAGPGKARQRLRNLKKELPDFFVSCNDRDPFQLLVLNEKLDAGEAEVLAQADFWRTQQAQQQVYALIDERKGRAFGRRLDIKVWRTGRLLVEMKNRALISQVQPYLDNLRSRTTFWLDDSAYRAVLRLAGELSRF